MANSPRSFAELSTEECWQAFSRRDVVYDGVFVTAVLTTGIYCRPSCSARQPLRQNVQFFADCAKAEASGFRPCKRCQPDQRPAEVRLVEAACRYIETELAQQTESLTIRQVSQEMAVSPSYLHRVFKRILGITPHQYLASQRLRIFTSYLKAGDSISQALYAAGYGSPSRVYENTHAAMGMTPREYQQGGKNVQIWYTIQESPLGLLLVGATAKGVCAVSLCDSPQELIDFLYSEYPHAEISYDDEHLSEYVAAILAHLAGQQPHLDLPVDIQVTAFQQKVLETLKSIPYGETWSYSEVAEAVGDEKAVRAVANACANNPVPLVYPCHRVTRKNGDLGGYRWGIARKKALLAREQASTIPDLPLYQTQPDNS